MALTDTQKEQMFKQYIPLAHKLAIKHAKKCRLSPVEIGEEAEGILAIVVSGWDTGGCTISGKLHPYDPKKCSPTSWIYRMLNWDLQTHCQRKQSKARPFSTLGDGERPVDMPRKVRWLERVVRDLGEDAKVLVTTIIDAPEEIMDDVSISSLSRTRKAVRGYLERQGWEAGRIDRAWAEVTVAL